MKKRLTVSIIAILVVLAFLILFYNTPVKFGNKLNPSEVDHINVFDGNTGAEFTIYKPEEIQYVVENVQSQSMKREKISLGYMGYSFRINYMDEDDKNIIPEFIVNSEDTIRRDPFFYRCDGGLCYDYLRTMEEAYVSN